MQVTLRPSIVVNAFSFGPRKGSEAGAAWETVQTLALEYRVTVVCDSHCIPNFTPEDHRELEKQQIGVRFFKVGSIYWMLRAGNFLTRVYYQHWQQRARPLFRSLVKETSPVALIHVSWGTGRIVSGIWNAGAPIVLGPMGGFESGDARIDRGLAWKTRLSEFGRRFHMRRSASNRGLARMYRDADLVLACTEESAGRFRDLGARRIELMTNAGITRARALALQELRKNQAPHQGFRLLFTSRFFGWKGEELIVRAIAELKDPETRVTLLGSGPNRDRCMAIAAELGVSSRIDFVSFLPKWDDVWAMYASHDAFLFPSLHDSGGTSVLEAMAAELPVICLDLGGPSEFIVPECGIKIPPADYREVIHGLAKAIAELRDDPARRLDMGKAAGRRCLKKFTWEARGDRLLALLRSVVAGR